MGGYIKILNEIMESGKEIEKNNRFKHKDANNGKDKEIDNQNSQNTNSDH